jgi:hypothetical protein
MQIKSLFFAVGILILATEARADVVYTSEFNRVGAYDISGSTINSNFITGYGGWGIAYYGGDLFVTNGSTVRDYTITGSVINSSLITGLNVARGIAFDTSGNLYVSNQSTGVIGKYGISNGSVVSSNPSFITISGVNDPTGVAVSGSSLYVAGFLSGTISKYNTTTGSLQSSFSASGSTFVAVAGSNLFITNWGAGKVMEYSTTGSLVNANLITGLSSPESIVYADGNLFIANAGNGTIGEYDTSGNPINAALISGLSGPNGLVVAPVPEPSSMMLLALANGGIGFCVWMRRRRKATVRMRS